MSTMKNELLVAAAHVLTAALNGVFQGIILVLLVSLGLRLLTRTNAATRHAIWFLTLLLLVLLIPFQYHVDQPNTLRLSFERSEPIKPSTLLLPIEGTISSSHAEQYPNLEANLNREKSFNPLFWKIGLPKVFPRATAPILLGVWAMLASVKLAMLVWRLREIRKLKLNSLLPPQGLQDLFLRVREELQITRPVALRVSTHRSPVVLGFAHPVILLPADGPQSSQTTQVYYILRHELAHVARWDDWTNLIQHSIRVAFFFHPAIWWASRQLSLEREIACDDSVLNQGSRPRSYALLLANLASRSEPSRALFAPGVSNNKSQLQTRINMILNTRRNTSPYLARTRLGIFTIAAAFAALIALYAAPRLVLAQAAALSAPTAELTPTDIAAGAEVTDTEPPDPGTPSTPPPAEVPPGPKYKSGDAPSEDMPLPASPPHTPRAPRPPRHRAFAKGPESAQAADPAVGAPEAKNEPLSIEERLARLEKMVRSLMRRQNLDEPRPHVGGGAEENELVQDELKHVQEIIKREAQLVTEQAKREVAQAKRETELAAEQAKRAVALAKREAELHARGIELDKHNATPEELDGGKDTLSHRREFLREDSNKDFDTLQKEHQRLEKEMERLNRQMERLQQDKQRMERERETP